MLTRNIDSIHSFRAWLLTKDPNESYVYADDRICACAQYYYSHGIAVDRWMHRLESFRLNLIAAMNKKRTFGGLLKDVDRIIESGT
jgi:hypothetical protein